jgi:hypothetical protein
MMPLAGGGRRADHRDASQDNWLDEDDDPWGSQDASPPSVIE